MSDTKAELQARFDSNHEAERHRDQRESGYWCYQYKLLCADLLAALNETTATPVQEAVQPYGYVVEFATHISGLFENRPTAFDLEKWQGLAKIVALYDLTALKSASVSEQKGAVN